ncbi:MAG: helix-turn-helix transcriptional regulator [Pyrinomonadaceae bacterium]|nr:helix-turn-helix transcriptional regulator [Pyrinomonadaceae bacterium]
MMFAAKKVAQEADVKRMVENIIRCKWSLSVIDLVKRGVNRPGAMEKSVDGLTTKVLNERLRKLVRFGILDREEFSEVPPRVEYRLTPFGEKFAVLLDSIDGLQEDLDRNGR